MIHILEGVWIEQLRFHYAEKVLHHGIVQTVALAAHALDDIVVTQRFLIDCMLIMPTLIRVQYQPFLYSILGVGRIQHVHDHLQVGMVRYGVADDFTVVHVEYRREVALVCAYVYLRHVGCPFLVWLSRNEVAVQYVRCGLADFAPVRTVLAAFTDVPQVLFPHDPADGLVIDGEALFSELIVYPAVAVAAPIFRMYGLDPSAFVRVAVRSLAEIVIVRGAGQSVRLQEMF